MRLSVFLSIALCVLSSLLHGQILAWEVVGLTGYGTSPFAPSSIDPNITCSGWTRGSGLTTTGTPASNAWGATGFSATSLASVAIANNDYVYFTVSANTGYNVSFSEIPTFRYRRSGTGPSSGLLQYQIGAGAFVDITTVSFSSTFTTGVMVTPLPIDLSVYTDLQDVPSGVVVTFRLVPLGASSTAGTWYIANSTALPGVDFVVDGIVNSATCTIPDDVTSYSGVATSGNDIDLSWSNATCLDAYLIVASEGGSVSSGTPSGDGSAYTADADFSGSGTSLLGGVVVYKGSSTSAGITGLNPGTMYCFKIFTRKGTDWSAGVETCITTLNPTDFEPGEMVFVGFDTHNAFGGLDKFSILVGKNMEPGTSFILANMLYEYRAAALESTGKWYNGNGTFTNAPPFVEITYQGSTVITKGSIICVELNTSPSNIVDAVEVNGVDASADFTDNNGGYVNVSSTTGADDAIWLLQGTFSNTFWDGVDSVRTFDGSVLGGIQFRDYFRPITVAGNAGGTRVSRIHPDIQCIGIDITTDAADYYGYYNSGAPHSGSIRTILGNIIDVSANWSIISGGSSIDNLVTTCSSTFTLTGALTDGEWLGYSDDDWFNCENWENFTVPDELTDVIISSLATNDAIVDDDSPNAILYGNNAKCKSLVIQNTRDMGIANSDDTLFVYGLTNITPGALLFNNNGGYHFNKGEMFIGSGAQLDLSNSRLELQGDFTNFSTEVNFLEANSEVTLSGSLDQAFVTSGFDDLFHKIIINKTLGDITLYNNIGINESLEFLSSTLINTGSNVLSVFNTDPFSITGYDLYAYINGSLKRNIDPIGSYAFPVGTSSQYELANIDINSSSGINDITVVFNPTTPSIPIGLLSEGPVVDGIVTPVLDFLNYGFWEINPDAVASVNYDITLTSRGHTNAAAFLDSHGIFKNVNALSATGWVEPGVVEDLPETELGSADPVTITNYGATSFSDFAIGFNTTYALPIDLLDFSATWVPQYQEVELKWETVSEINNDYFTVERSGDGHHFTSIGEIPGAVNSNTTLNYRLVDTNPLPGNSYYRLKQTDLNGITTYSDKEVVQWILANNLSFYPNPTSNWIYINSNSSGAVRILNLDGKLLIQQKIVEGTNKISTEHLLSGPYLLEIKSGTEVFQDLIIKQ